MVRFRSFSLTAFLLTLFAANISAQQKKPLRFTDAHTLTITGKAWDSEPFYHRLDTARYAALSGTLKRLATHSAGLAISFKTNSSTISAKWQTSPKRPSDNMTGIAYEGLDLYILQDARWQYAGVARPSTHDISETTIVENMADGEKTCLLFLPTYDEILCLEIGIDAEASIVPNTNPFRKNILIYGSSIVQGASASRPGLAYPAKLSRQTGYHFINMGFSGNAKMETAVADMIAPLPMDAFILDCVPNPSAEEVLERTANMVNTIRRYHPNVPIIAIQSVAREKGNFDQHIARRIKLKDQYFRQEIEKLQKDDDNLYLIEAEGLLGDDQEGTADGIHPNDLGFERMLQKIRPTILEIFAKYGI
ncbi:SGNH/GDSL hydrolase family protein [Sphingobacterium pedocola]|uniref:Hydrolase n=1 Tax=Sphingobacterium pedocola TaxID=2082722 RepID=A0ABR9T2N1_9SPHI|nr:SGNH/GDSL hydrolase family protein [Sphingobacterium pedocola]MBE8719600.1 hydrolase [Sphingobacterium pedocola]